MSSVAELDRIVDDCRAQGANLPLERFEEGCRMVAARLERPLSDDGLEGHFRALVSAGDRLAAVHLVMPYGWAYHLQRDTTGRVSASIAARDLGHQEVVESDDEGVALLAALALALQSGPTAAVLARR